MPWRAVSGEDFLEAGDLLEANGIEASTSSQDGWALLGHPYPYPRPYLLTLLETLAHLAPPASLPTHLSYPGQ